MNSKGKNENSSRTRASTVTTTMLDNFSQEQQQKYRQQSPTIAKNKNIMSADERQATRKSLVILAAIFITSLATLSYVYMIFPELNVSEKEHIKVPRNIQDVKMLANVLDRYKEMYYFEVMFGITTTYVLYPF